MNDQQSILPHDLAELFPVRDDCLHIGGEPLPQVAQRAGQTPFYAYDRGIVSARVTALRRLLPAGISLHYAVKANPMPALVQHLAGQVDGMDVASAGELRVALDAGVPAAHISMAGPGKSKQDLTAAIASGVTVNLESESELARAADLARSLDQTARVAVRVNPDFELKSSGMKMGGGPKAFGIDAERVPAVLTEIGRRPELAFRGFHIFTGSQNLRAESLQEAHERTFELAHRLAAEAPAPVRLLNIGGGFGIPYFPGDKPLDVAAVAASLADHLAGTQHLLPEAEVVLELGRYLVGEAGIYVAEVVDRKLSRGQVFLVTNGGLHHHLAASGNFGQVLRKNYPVAIGNRVRGTERETVTVSGPLCTPLDVLADRLEMARAEPGDLVVVFQSGAYGYTASPTRFLSHPEPVEVVVG